jgi:hypothetical protein
MEMRVVDAASASGMRPCTVLEYQRSAEPLEGITGAVDQPHEIGRAETRLCLRASVEMTPRQDQETSGQELADGGDGDEITLIGDYPRPHRVSIFPAEASPLVASKLAAEFAIAGTDPSCVLFGYDVDGHAGNLLLSCSES